jgi:hypothetical protein
MIQEINSFIDGNQNFYAYPIMNNVGGILLPSSVVPIQNFQNEDLNPMITEDYK